MAEKAGFENPRVISRRDDPRGIPTVWADIRAYKGAPPNPAQC